MNETAATPAPMCEHQGCTAPADGALALQFFPPRAVMKHYRTDKPLTNMVLGLKVCRAHLKGIDPVTFLGAQIMPLIKVVERSSGIAVDMAATKAVLVPLDDPDYLLLLKQRQEP